MLLGPRCAPIAGPSCAVIVLPPGATRLCSSDSVSSASLESVEYMTARFVNGACSSAASRIFAIALRCERDLAVGTITPSWMLSTGLMRSTVPIAACGPLSRPPRLRYSRVSGVPRNAVFCTMLLAACAASSAVAPSSSFCLTSNASQDVLIDTVVESMLMILFPLGSACLPPWSADAYVPLSLEVI